MASLARALRLSRDERDYLFGLAGVAPPLYGPSAHIDAAMLDLLDKITGVPAQLFTDLYELAAQNDLATALLAEPLAASGSGSGDSQLWRWFLDPATARTRYPPETHADMSRSYVADLRATSGRHPGDVRVSQFILRLRAASAEFDALWESAAVEVRRSGPHRVLHPSVGLIDLQCTGLLSEDGRHRLVWYTPCVGGQAAQQLQLLTVVGATRFTDRPTTVTGPCHRNELLPPCSLT